ncbi:MAG: hypothetical protein SFX18_05405 [Pirellulales bacterium]|nr:hypothetical protein [Pirellulales bacterium]
MRFPLNWREMAFAGGSCSTLFHPWIWGGVLFLGCFLLSGCTSRPSNTPSKTISQRSVAQDRQQVILSLVETVGNWHLALDTENQRKLVLDRLNEWASASTNQPKSINWEPSALAARLPINLRQLPSMADLGTARFTKPDVDAMREATWLNSISRRIAEAPLSRQPAATADESSAPRERQVKLATALFDWTIRQIALIEPEWQAQNASPLARWRAQNEIPLDRPQILYTPYETVLDGRGTALMRAAVFLGLARQAELDAVLIGLPDEQILGRVRPWLIGVLVSGDSSPQADNAQTAASTADATGAAAGQTTPGQASAPLDVILFDPLLGLPLTAANEKYITLAELQKDPALLQSWNIGDFTYPAPTAEQLAQVVALIDAPPATLTRRMRQLQADFPERLRRILAVDTARLADATRQAGIERVELWWQPLLVAAARQQRDPRLLNAMGVALEGFEASIPEPDEDEKNRRRAEDFSDWERMEILNNLDPVTGEYKGSARPQKTKKSVKLLQRGRLLQLRGEYLGSGSLTAQVADTPHSAESDYLTDRGAIFWLQLALLPQELEQQLLLDQQQLGYYELRRDMNLRATLWLGLIQADRREYAAAVRYLAENQQRSWLNWRGSATYNFARAHAAWAESLLTTEASDRDHQAAIEHYRAAITALQGDKSAQREGNMLLARKYGERVKALESGEGLGSE